MIQIPVLLAAALDGAAAGGDAAAAAGPMGCAGGGMSMPIMMLLTFGVFYFLILRPQSKKAKEHGNMLNALQKGDQVVTRGGIIGKISGVQDNIIVLELQEKVRVRVYKSYIEGKVSDGQATQPAGAASESKN